MGSSEAIAMSEDRRDPCQVELKLGSGQGRILRAAGEERDAGLKIVLGVRNMMCSWCWVICVVC